MERIYYTSIERNITNVCDVYDDVYDDDRNDHNHRNHRNHHNHHNHHNRHMVLYKEQHKDNKTYLYIITIHNCIRKNKNSLNKAYMVVYHIQL